MIVQREGNRILISEPLGFDFDDGRIVLTIRQARDLEALLAVNRSWLMSDEESEGEDG